MDPIKIEILGSGCKKCHQLEENAKLAASTLNLKADFSHITDPMGIAERGVMKTPALAVNGKVLSQGKVLSPEQIQPLLQQ
ncbi:MAG: thioredoxin family protein [Thermostichus sp. DG02_5_bins_236]